MQKLRFHIPNISCSHCIHTIKTELLEIDGVVSVFGDIENKEIEVEFNSPLTVDKIVDHLTEINYPVG